MIYFFQKVLSTFNKHETDQQIHDRPWGERRAEKEKNGKIPNSFHSGEKEKEQEEEKEGGKNRRSCFILCIGKGEASSNI